MSIVITIITIVFPTLWSFGRGKSSSGSREKIRRKFTRHEQVLKVIET